MFLYYSIVFVLYEYLQSMFRRVFVTRIIYYLTFCVRCRPCLTLKYAELHDDDVKTKMRTQNETKTQNECVRARGAQFVIGLARRKGF